VSYACLARLLAVSLSAAAQAVPALEESVTASEPATPPAPR
jgi:hypothetical protein